MKNKTKELIQILKNFIKKIESNDDVESFDFTVTAGYPLYKDSIFTPINKKINTKIEYSGASLDFHIKFKEKN